MAKALFEIVHHVGNDTPLTVAVVFDTEQKVKMAVNRLNHKICATWSDSYIDCHGKHHYCTEDELNEFGGYDLDVDFYNYVPVTLVSALDVVNALRANSLKKGE